MSGVTNGSGATPQGVRIEAAETGASLSAQDDVDAGEHRVDLRLRHSSDALHQLAPVDGENL
jgi:hypothetical protein